MAVDHEKVKLIDDIRSNIHHLHKLDKDNLRLVLDLIVQKDGVSPFSREN
jgi:hypothetical protein